MCVCAYFSRFVATHNKNTNTQYTIHNTNINTHTDKDVPFTFGLSHPVIDDEIHSHHTDNIINTNQTSDNDNDTNIVTNAKLSLLTNINNILHVVSST